MVRGSRRVICDMVGRGWRVLGRGLAIGNGGVVRGFFVILQRNWVAF